MKYEIRNEKQTPMSEIQNTKHYDLEERTFLFAKNVRSFVRKLPKTIANKVNKNILFSFGFRYSDF